MSEIERILQVERDIEWLPRPNEGVIALSSQLPPLELIATAFALAFMDGRLLMTHLRHRGWDIPGGHVEPGETPEQTVRREVYEETAARLGPLHVLGYQRLRLLGPRPASSRYPYPDCYQVFYRAHIVSLDDFQPTAETQGRTLLSPEEARVTAWVQRHSEFYEAALGLALNEARGK